MRHVANKISWHFSGGYEVGDYDYSYSTSEGGGWGGDSSYSGGCGGYGGSGGGGDCGGGGGGDWEGVVMKFGVWHAFLRIYEEILKHFTIYIQCIIH